MDNIITGQNIVKTYENKSGVNRVLNDVNISLEKGGFVAIMGASGSGKSTLLNVLSSMDTFESGSVSYLENNLETMNEQELANLRLHHFGFVFQQPTFLKNLTILDNILLPALKSHKFKKTESLAYAKELMHLTGINAIENSSITEVSGGQLQRAGICRALINKPNILFCDEPTGALNSNMAEEIMNLLSDIHKKSKTTIVLVTHDVKMAAYTDTVFLMSDGVLVEEIILKESNAIEIKIKLIHEKNYHYAI